MEKNKELMLFGLSENERTLKGVWLVLGVYLFASLFAAVFTAPAYWLVQWVDLLVSPESASAAERKLADITSWLLGKRIDIYYDRLRWVPIVLGIPYLMRKCGLFSVKNLGVEIKAKTVLCGLKYFALGAGVAACVFVLQWFFCSVGVAEGVGVGQVAGVVFKAVFAAFILACLEETVFRALIFRCVYTAFGGAWAVVLTSLFFAYKHFKVPNSAFDAIEQLTAGGGSYSWDVGFFVAYYDTIGISFDFNAVTFLNLLLFGVLLSVIYLKTRVLWSNIGFHAGIVFSIFVYRSLFEISRCPQQEIFGSAGLSNGYVPLAALCAVLVALFVASRAKKGGRCRAK